MNLLLRVLLAIGLVAAIIWNPGSVGAHGHLERSTPSAGEKLAQPPREVRLWFTEAVVANLSSVKLLDGAGSPVAGTIQSSPAPKELALSVPEAPAGSYTVSWKILSVDSHTSEGTFTFTVASAPPAQAPAPGAAAAPAQPTQAPAQAPAQPVPAPAEASSARPPIGLVGGGAALALALAGGAVALLLVRRRRGPTRP